jgi:hypothetical protein
MSNFSIFASWRCELTSCVELTFSPSPGLKGKIFFYWFYIGKIIRAPDSSKHSKYGLQVQETRTGAVSIFKIFPQKPHLHEPRSEILVRGNFRSCGKSSSPAPPTE